VSTEGVELDFLARPVDNLSLSGGIAYTDAKVDNFFTPPGSPPTVRDDTKLPLAPEWKATLAADYRAEFDAVDVIPGMLFVYTDEQYADLNEPEITLIPSFSTIDLTVAIADKSDRYRVTFIGRNITDESYAALITRGGPANAPRLQIPRDADRYFGVQLRANFGGGR
jgi:iron complex outermembrane recepter protein